MYMKEVVDIWEELGLEEMLDLYDSDANQSGGSNTPPPPPNWRPNSADLADLFYRFVGFLNFADLLCPFIGFL